MRFNQLMSKQARLSQRELAVDQEEDLCVEGGEQAAVDPEAHREGEAASATEVPVEAVVEVQGEGVSAQLVEDLEEEIPTSPGQEVAFEDVDHN